jgi:hypothetical protein
MEEAPAAAQAVVAEEAGKLNLVILLLQKRTILLGSPFLHPAIF